MSNFWAKSRSYALLYEAKRPANADAQRPSSKDEIHQTLPRGNQSVASLAFLNAPSQSLHRQVRVSALHGRKHGENGSNHYLPAPTRLYHVVRQTVLHFGLRDAPGNWRVSARPARFQATMSHWRLESGCSLRIGHSCCLTKFDYFESCFLDRYAHRLDRRQSTGNQIQFV